MIEWSRRLPDDPFVCACCGADATKLRMLADLVEALWAGRTDKTEVEDDLRMWADAIDERNA